MTWSDALAQVGATYLVLAGLIALIAAVAHLLGGASMTAREALRLASVLPLVMVALAAGFVAMPFVVVAFVCGTIALMVLAS